MSQLFLAAGPQSDDVKSLFRRALGLFGRIAQVRPLNVIERDGLALALFDSVERSGSAHIVTNKNGFAAGVGSWFHDGVAQGDLAPLMDEAGSRAESIARIMERYDGFFAFVVATGSVVTIVTDLLGRLHLYEARIGSTRVVSTSSLVIAALAAASWDMQAVREFLALGFLLGQRSLFQGVRKVPAAAVITQSVREPDRVTRTTYWRVDDWAYARNDRCKQFGVEALARSLRASVASIFESYAQPAMDLTGGFDSRMLLAAALKDFPASRFETVVSGEPESGDVRAARTIADRMGLSHNEYPVQPTDVESWWSLAQRALALVDGEYDVVEYACILNIHLKLATRFSASINGSGGEVCRGYWWELLLPFLGCHGHFNPHRVAAARFPSDDWAGGVLAADFDQSLSSQIAESLVDIDRAVDGSLNTARMDNIYLLVRMQRWQGRIASATSRIWPCFSPFLMKMPLRVALGASVGTRVANRMPRRMIHHCDPKLAALPMDSGNPASPLTFTNAHRFHRLPMHWAGRAVRKTCRSLGFSSKATSTREPAAVAVLLWGYAPFREWWSQPLTETLYRDGALNEFLRYSQQNGQGGAARFGRVLTLELVARTLRSNA